MTWSPNWRKFRKETFHTLYWIPMIFWVFCSQYFGDRFQIFWLKNFNQRKHYVLCREKKYLRKKNVLLVTPKLSPSKIGKTLRLTSTTDFFLIKNSFFKFYLQKTLGIFNSNKNCHMYDLNHKRCTFSPWSRSIFEYILQAHSQTFMGKKRSTEIF